MCGIWHVVLPLAWWYRMVCSLVRTAVHWHNDPLGTAMGSVGHGSWHSDLWHAYPIFQWLFGMLAGFGLAVASLACQPFALAPANATKPGAVCLAHVLGKGRGSSDASPEAIILVLGADARWHRAGLPSSPPERIRDAWTTNAKGDIYIVGTIWKWVGRMVSESAGQESSK